MLFAEIIDNFNSISIDPQKSFAFSFELIEDINKEYKKLDPNVPYYGSRINYKDDIWTFRDNINLSLQKSINFQCPYPFLKEQLKQFFILQLLLGKNRIATNIVNAQMIKTAFTKLLDASIHKDIFLLSDDELEEYIHNKNVSATYNQRRLPAIEAFIEFLNKNNEEKTFITLEHIADIKQHVKSYITPALKEANKYPNIPDNVLSCLIDKFTQVIDDENYSFKAKITAVAILIMSQTGLRASDILTLKFKSFKSIKTIKGQELYFIEYSPLKVSKVNQKAPNFETICNVLSLKAYKCITKLYPNFSPDDYLFRQPNSNTPLSLSWLKKRFFLLYYNVMPEEILFTPNDKLTLLSVQGKKCYIPQLPQFRVSFCTELYNKKVPLAYIKRFMGHATESMTAHYYHEEEKKVQEVKNFIQEVVVNNSNLLGGTQRDMFIKSIKDFIEKDKLNIDKDLNKIIKKISSKLNIRAKRGGICVRPVDVICSDEITLNSVMCASNICPNLYHFYFMIDESLVDARTSFALMEQYKAKEMTCALTNEALNLKYILEKRVKTEWEELLKEINQRGEDEICKLHPNLKDIIQQKDIIAQEIIKWDNMLALVNKQIDAVVTN